MKKKLFKFKDTGFDDTLFDETCWQPGSRTINDKEMVAILETMDKVVTLLDHYGIAGGLDSPMNGWSLALKLADDHVPGFAPKHRLPIMPAHRPPKLALGFRDLIIYLELSRAKREGKKVAQAARDLAERWQKEGKGDWSGEVLRARYYRICQDGVPTKGMVWAMHKMKKSRSTSED